MGSVNAKLVAKKVLEKAGNGETVSVSAIAREVGYKEGTAKNPQQITRTKSYQEEIMPVVEMMERERNRIMLALQSKDLDKERHKDLVDSMDKMTKNIQLLSGKETERAGVSINVVSYDPGNSSTPIST